MRIGSIVTLVYTGTLENGTVFGYATPENPLVLQTGMDLAVDGFEEAILQMSREGERKVFTLNEYEAYGEYREGQRVKIPLEQIPPERVGVGKIAYLPDEVNGSVIAATCIDVSDRYAEYDLNHPLAGKKLAFEVELLAIQDPPAGFVSVKERMRELKRQYGSFGL